MIDLKKLAFDNNLKQKDLGDILGLDQSQVSLMVNGRRDITPAHIDMLVAHFGGDVIEKYTVPDEVTEIFRNPTMRRTAATIIPAEVVDEIVGEHSTMQRCGDTRALSIEECNELCPARLPYVKGEIVQSRDVDIRHLIESEPQKLEFRTMRQMIGNPNYVQKVITAAMMPLFQPGDMLFVQFLPEDAKIISGAIYLVDTRVYGAMVRQVYLEDNDVYTLHSLNPDFKELHLRRDEIYSISLVVRSLRSDFNMPKVAPDTAEAYKRRDEQIEQLLSMHRDAMTEIRTQNERMAEERRRQDEERKAERDRLDKLIDRIMK